MILSILAFIFCLAMAVFSLLMARGAHLAEGPNSNARFMFLIVAIINVGAMLRILIVWVYF